MISYLQHQQDFIILLQGSLLLLIAAQAGLLRKLDPFHGWGWISLASGLLAFGEWVEIAQLLLANETVVLPGLRFILWLSVFACLACWFWGAFRGSGKWKYKFGSYRTMMAVVLGGILLSYMGRFALVLANDWMDTVLVVYRPGQIMVCLTLFLVLGLRHSELCNVKMDTRSYRSLMRWRWVWTIAALAVLLIGGLASEYEGDSSEKRMRAEILSRTHVAAAMISAEQVNALTWTEADLESSAYIKLKAMMRSLVKANPDFRFAMLMGVGPGEVRFLVDSEPPESSDYSPPGQVYEEAEELYLRTVAMRKPFVLGPIVDRWGKWVSASVPIEGCESAKGWVTMDFDVKAQDWDRKVALSRLPVLLLSFMMLALLAALVLAFEQVRASAALANSSERRSRTIVEGSRNCVQLLDRDACFVVVNRNGQEALGRGAEELIGLSFVSIWPPISRPTIGEMVRVTLKGEPASTEAEYVRPDGKIMIWSMSTSPILSEQGELTGFVCISIDITERKRVELELRNAKEAAESAMRAKGEFLAVMSHEIRTPLSGVISLLGLLQKEPLAATERHYADLARDNAETLLQILDDLLDAAKIEAGKLSMEAIPFHLSRTMSPVLEVMRMRAEAKGLALTCEMSPDIPHVLLGDPTRLRQVLANLLSNAVKFTSSGSVHISISSDMVPPEWVMLHMKVSDTGVGIPREAQSKLFNKFAQADTTTTRRFGGTGLGLSIVKSIAEMMGGSIVMESEEGKGSCFTYSALLAVGTGSETTEPEVVLDQSSVGADSDLRLKLLYAEDNETNQFILQSHLMLLGHDLDFANDGAQALELLRVRHYDAVFMDSRMPVMDGLTATRALRDTRTGTLDPQIYVIALTANSTEADRDRSLESGMNDYLTKPVNEGELRRALSRIIAYQRRRNIEMCKRSELEGDLQAVPGLSAAELLAMAGVDGDEDPAAPQGSGLSASTLRTITRQFIDDAPKRLRTMREALATENKETLAITAHSLKSVARYVSATELAELCAKLEALADAGQFAAAGPLFSLVEQAIGELLPRLEQEDRD